MVSIVILYVLTSLSLADLGLTTGITQVDSLEPDCSTRSGSNENLESDTNQRNEQGKLLKFDDLVF